jgi:hypothetical protein
MLLLEPTYFLAQSRIQELSATPFNQNIVINYLISAGNSCAGYQIYRSTDSVNFDLIHDYAGICGETTKSQSITFKDEQPEKNKNNYYKVLVQPLDYSNVVSVFFSDLSEKGYLLVQNPVYDKLVVLTSLNSKTLKIYSQNGVFIKSLSPNQESQFEENISNLDNGLYYFIIENNTSNILRGKFIKQ